MSPISQVRCREIDEADFDPIADLLTAGYQGSKRDFWVRRLKRLSKHSALVGFPKFGFLLEYRGAPIGTIFTIFSRVVGSDLTQIRCYLSSWYVAPDFRSYAIMLASHALK